MRIVTWNCCRGSFQAKVEAAAAAFRPDLLVLQEASEPSSVQPNTVWVGPKGKIGVAIVASAPYVIHPLPLSDDVPKFFVPVQVSGPNSFVLVAIWTVSSEKYVRGLVIGLRTAGPNLREQTLVLAGDFNSYAIWDKEHPSDLNHSAMLREMDRLGLSSAYHGFMEEAPGEESRPTYFYYRHKDKPFHLHYCFVPSSWSHGTVVDVGSYEAWSDFSDHCPLVVDVAVPHREPQ